MDVMVTARRIGVVAENGGDVPGAIEESVVLSVLAELALTHEGNDDLFADAAMRVQLCRSAGQEHIERDSVFAVNRATREIQLRYRSEIADVFRDLAIDLALRDAGSAVVAGV